jgi:hypothetical protein
MVYYFDNKSQGIIIASSHGDGYNIDLKWHKAFPTNKTNSIAYQIYMATAEIDLFSEGVKFVSIDGSLSTTIEGLTPGQLYFFAVRAVEYSPVLFDINNLQRAFNNLVVYPQSLLIANITASSNLIPVLDTTTFPNYGVVQIGYEMINYSSVNNVANTLNLTNATTQRGFFNTVDSFHDTDGYDGYNTIFPAYVTYTFGREELNKSISSEACRFEYPYYPYDQANGFKQVTNDYLTTNLTVSDSINENFPTYDYAGYHRTNPVELLNGTCVGSYIGGEMGCADGYGGVGMMVRGLSVQNQNTQRQDILLNLTGESVVLLQRQTTGIICSCYTSDQEYADDRCPYCYGTKLVVGYTQYFNPRRADGMILVRFGPGDDDLIPYDSGLESTFTVDCWTLTVPTVKDRDIIIRYDEGGNEEFRYEILYVNRNKMLLDMQGVQKFRVQRIRKFDIAYQIRAFPFTQFFPQSFQTGLSNAVPGLPPHSHSLVINENVTSVSQINQTTGVTLGHNHPVYNGTIGTDILGHTHLIVLPVAGAPSPNVPIVTPTTPSTPTTTPPALGPGDIDSYGTISSTYNAPAGVQIGQLVYITSAGDTVALADCGSMGAHAAIGYIVENPTSTSVVIQYDGELGGFTGLVPGALYYLSTTPGAFSITAPVLSNFIVQNVGIAKDATTMIIKIDTNYTLL